MKSVALLVSRPEIRSVRPDARPEALLVSIDTGDLLCERALLAHFRRLSDVSNRRLWSCPDGATNGMLWKINRGC
jgi:hypothetical protein